MKEWLAHILDIFTRKPAKTQSNEISMLHLIHLVSDVCFWMRENEKEMMDLAGWVVDYIYLPSWLQLLNANLQAH